MNTVEILKKAKALLIKDGWLKNYVGRADGAKCLIGAVYFAKGYGPTHGGTSLCSQLCAVELGYLKRAYSSMEKFSVYKYMDVHEVNDSIEATYEDVLHILDAATDLAEKEKVPT